MDDGSLEDLYSQQSIGYFLDSVIINSHPEPKQFGVCADDWQRELVGPKIRAFDGLMGLSDYEGPLSFLSVLARGHDKSSLEGRLLSGALCYSRRKIEGYLVAADRDQAGLIKRAMQDEAALNPWYGERLEFTRDKIIGPSGQVTVLPADASSAYGLRGNLYVIDEVTNWKCQRGQDVWNAVVSGREKVPGSLLMVISNAGILHSWQDKFIRQIAKASDDWVVFEREGNLASWMSEKRRNELRKIIPPLEASRLLDNKWINAAEASGYLVPADVLACVDSTVEYRPHRNPRYRYVVAVDYGRVKDRTVMVLMHMDESGVIVIDDLTVLEPTAGRPIAVSQVESWVDDTWNKYTPQKLIFDPYQMEAVIQRLERQHKPVERFNTRSGGGNQDLALLLRGLITNRKIKWSPKCDRLSGELINLVTKVTSYGFKFDHLSGQHDDQAVAIAMGAAEAVKLPAYPEAKAPRHPQVVKDEQDEELEPQQNPLQTWHQQSRVKLT